MKKPLFILKLTVFILLTVTSASILPLFCYNVLYKDNTAAGYNAVASTAASKSDSVYTGAAVASAASTTSAAPRQVEMRGVWVASVVNIDYPSAGTVDAAILKNEATTILDNVKSMGLNAVFLQVRPTSDAFYKSQYFPWSKYLTGKQGQSPAGGFDPLEFWVTEAHKRGIELHAWLNPYRITKIEAGDAKHDFASLDPTNPARLHPEWVVKYQDGNLYYNPGIPEVRKLIIDGAMEIVRNYSVDGIHFDDYFYPGTKFNDNDTFKKYGAGFSNIDDWRRENVNILIRELSAQIKKAGRQVRFGISPFGIWANKETNSLGSDTRGLQSYYEHYADSRKWVKDGIIDYIIPQIYWNIGYSVADYQKLLAWWSDVVAGTGVELYVGHAAYKAGNSDPASVWYGLDEIGRQLEMNYKNSEVDGSVFYNYSSLAGITAFGQVLKATFEQRDGLKASVPLSVSRPSGSIRTSYSQYFLNGASDPKKPLYLNGNLVSGRSSSGYFGLLVNLNKGANIFTFSQEASYKTFVIYRETGSATPQKVSKIEIPAASVFPQSQELRTAGEKVTLTCQAPSGSSVTVKLGGKTYTMKAASASTGSPGQYMQTYQYVYAIPSYKGTPRVVDIGKPVYTMNYNKTVKTRQAPASIGVVISGAPYYAEVTKDVIDTYDAPVTGNGAAYELYKGMIDSITGMTGSYVRLSSGQWVRKSEVKTLTLKSVRKPVINSVVYTTGKEWDTVKFNLNIPAAAITAFENNVLKVTISANSQGKSPKLPQDSLFSSVKVTGSSSGSYKAVYDFTAKTGTGKIEGYYLEKTSAGLTLHIKRHVAANTAKGALSGITVMIDPGHGGNENGAIGPLGTKYPEKTINLNTSLKLKEELEKLGAKVHMTRSSDVALTLVQRLALSRNTKPDLFISIHSNSMNDNVDISKIVGFSAFYNEDVAKKVTESVYNKVISELGRKKLGINVRNFYVTRGTWCPHILLEGGFVPNQYEFEWLTAEEGQRQYAKSIAAAVADYFAK